MPEQRIESDALAVTVDTAFPRVLGYEWKATGAHLGGQRAPVRHVIINGLLQTPKVSCEATACRAAYTLKCAEGKCEIDVVLEVAANVLRLQVSAIREQRWFPVKTFEIPGHGLVSVSSDQPGAMLVAVTGSPLIDTTETFAAVGDTPYDLQPRPLMYGILHTDELAATIHNNTMHDSARLRCLTVEAGSARRSSLWNGEWVCRGVESEVPVLPCAQVVVTADRNGDGVVDWQDAALAYREVMTRPLGADSIRSWVVSQIAMNFASLAQNPFLRVLDNIKKVFLYTDGLGQMVQFKGFQSEGHDSAHPDYAGNINRRAGGAGELRFVMERLRGFNCAPGVHINATEAYPEARAYSSELVYDVDNWRWLDQSKSIDKHRDAVSGDLGRRLAGLHEELPDVRWIYVDVYFGLAWDAWKLARTLHDCGWAIFTEFPHVMEREAVWTHTSQEFDGWGVKSKVARFIHNHEKDTWPRTMEPMLRGSRNLGFLGWHSERSIPEFIRNLFTNNLPTKYIQHFPIRRWTENRIDCEGEVEITNEDGIVTIRRHGQPVAVGDSIFLPWDPVTEERIYHWNAEGGAGMWALPRAWAGAESILLFRLTDTGRVFEAELPVAEGCVTIAALKDTPYVLYREQPAALPDVQWGEGSPLADPGFDSHAFEHWRPASATGGTEHITIRNDENGQTHLCIAGPRDGSVSQPVVVAAGATYALSAWIEVDGCRRTSIGLRLADGTEYTNYLDCSPTLNYSDNQAKYLTRYQRVKVVATIPAGVTEAVVVLGTEAGARDTAARFDDVRLTRTEPCDPRGHWFFEDFENCDEGWGPFVYGHRGDVRTHLSERHDPFTDDVINGNWSLKTMDEQPRPKEDQKDPAANEGKNGCVVRTLPHTLRFAPDTTYAISFLYRTDNAGQYRVVVRADSDDAAILDQALDSTATHFEAEIATGARSDCYLAVMKDDNERGMLVLDDLAVDPR